MRKSSYYPLVILVISAILFLIAYFVDVLPIQIKLMFFGKVGLAVGFIGLWIFTILPLLGNRNKN